MKWILGLASVLLCSGAEAGVSTTPVTVGATSAACLSGGQLPASVTYLFVKNEAASGGNAVAFALGYGSLPTAALNTAGSITLLPGASQFFGSPVLGGSWLACVAAGAGTPVTIVVYGQGGQL